MTGYETYSLINHCGKCNGRYKDCAKECPYYALCQTYQKSTGFTTQEWLKEQKKNPEFFKALCALYDIPLYAYYEEEAELFYMLSDLHQFYEKEFDKEQKKEGTDFTCWMCDCERAGILVRMQQDIFSFPIQDFQRIKEVISHTTNTAFTLYVQFSDPKEVTCWLIRSEREAVFRKRWSHYDELTAKGHLATYGVVILDYYHHPLDNEYDLELVSRVL